MNWQLTEVTVRMSVFTKKDPSNELSFTNFFADVRPLLFLQRWQQKCLVRNCINVQKGCQPHSAFFVFLMNLSCLQLHENPSSSHLKVLGQSRHVQCICISCWEPPQVRNYVITARDATKIEIDRYNIVVVSFKFCSVASLFYNVDTALESIIKLCKMATVRKGAAWLLRPSAL